MQINGPSSRGQPSSRHGCYVQLNKHVSPYDDRNSGAVFTISFPMTRSKAS